MSEQDTAAEVQPNADSPVENGAGNDDASVDWQGRYQDLEKRFNDTQSWGTKAAQEAAELRAFKQLVDDWNSDDPDRQQAAAERLGIQLEEEDSGDFGDEGQYAPVDPKILQRLEAFEAQQAQQEATQTEQQQYAAYRADVDPQIAKMGVPEGLRDAVAEAALSLPGVQTPQGLRPDLEGALKQITQFAIQAAALPGVQQQVIESYRKTKQAPHIPSSGQAGTQVPPLGNHANRVKRALELDALNDL